MRIEPHWYWLLRNLEATNHSAAAGLEEARGRIDTEELMAVMSLVHDSTLWTSLHDLEDLSLVLALPGVDPSTWYRFSPAESIARMDATAEARE